MPSTSSDSDQAAKEFMESICKLTVELKLNRDEMKKLRNSLDGLDKTGSRSQDIMQRLGMAIEALSERINVISGIGSGVTAIAKTFFSRRR